MSVRIRYAPSPTGSPHVGNIRTALFDHLFARHFGGVNVLRIEDTDRNRFVPGCEEENIEALTWLGIEWQEGPDKGGPFAPYRQSERKQAGIYDQWVQVLLESGNAYKAFDTPEELEEMREYQRINKQDEGYFGGIWRDASPAKVEEAIAAGKPFVIRQKVPRGTKIEVTDGIRGRIEFDSDTVDDPVLIKADGMPTYHFAAMVDDHLMEITHVIRGEEWISSAPKHLALFKAFGWTPPQFVHVPVIKGTDGKKLSKRHGDTALLDFRPAGYLPEALANFIALIGWSPGGDRELMSMQEMAEAFTFDGLQPSSGIFDKEKLNWMNGNYVRSLGGEELIARVHSFVSAPETPAYWFRDEHKESDVASKLEVLRETIEQDASYALSALLLEQERVTTLADMGPACEFFMVEEPAMDPKAVEKWFGEAHVRDLFQAILDACAERETIEPEECEKLLRDWAADNGFEKLGPVVHPTRVALTGKTTGPGLFELMSVLGPARMTRRLNRAMAMLTS
ncbi:MAG: glutamate--tRNA ligase [Fimbriimonadaceae bacterium]|nr:glutamate--tRNA ligase [Fimbriimonadaceae bacterium]